MNETIEQSQSIIQRAIANLNPYAILVMVSGGSDSLTAYTVARELGVSISGIAHVVTGTGIPETTDWVRQWAAKQPYPYYEANAGDAYERYVLRKGFLGRGERAHAYAYHILKAEYFRKLISKNFRQRKRGRRILLINGARSSESENRMFKLDNQDIQQEGRNQNYWANLIRHWDKNTCYQYLGEKGVQINTVSQVLHRSGECMCGPTQSPEERKEASFWYPQWGAWLDDLERQVKRKYHWGWGENIPKGFAQEKAGQMPLPGFRPMCSSCALHQEKNA